MKFRKVAFNCACAICLTWTSASCLAVTAVSTVNVKVARFLTITNTQSLEFGSVSVSATAGTVSVTHDNTRFATGGVTINPADSYSPAKFIIEGNDYITGAVVNVDGGRSVF